MSGSGSIGFIPTGSFLDDLLINHNAQNPANPQPPANAQPPEPPNSILSDIEEEGSNLDSSTSNSNVGHGHNLLNNTVTIQHGAENFETFSENDGGDGTTILDKDQFSDIDGDECTMTAENQQKRAKSLPAIREFRNQSQTHVEEINQHRELIGNFDAPNDPNDHSPRDNVEINNNTNSVENIDGDFVAANVRTALNETYPVDCDRDHEMIEQDVPIDNSDFDGGQVDEPMDVDEVNTQKDQSSVNTPTEAEDLSMTQSSLNTDSMEERYKRLPERLPSLPNGTDLENESDLDLSNTFCPQIPYGNIQSNFRCENQNEVLGLGSQNKHFDENGDMQQNECDEVVENNVIEIQTSIDYASAGNLDQNQNESSRIQNKDVIQNCDSDINMLSLSSLNLNIEEFEKDITPKVTRDPIRQKVSSNENSIDQDLTPRPIESVLNSSQNEISTNLNETAVDITPSIPTPVPTTKYAEKDLKKDALYEKIKEYNVMRVEYFKVFPDDEVEFPLPEPKFPPRSEDELMDPSNDESKKKKDAKSRKKNKRTRKPSSEYTSGSEQEELAKEIPGPSDGGPRKKFKNTHNLGQDSTKSSKRSKISTNSTSKAASNQNNLQSNVAAVPRYNFRHSTTKK